MSKVIHCEDLGFRCDAVARGDTEEELLNRVAEHAASAHGITEITDELAAKVRAVIREE